MGFYIGLADKDYNDHPDCEISGYSGGRDLMILLSEIETSPLGDSVIRPKSIKAFREVIEDMEVNRKLWNRMADIMEEDEKYGIGFSY